MTLSGRPRSGQPFAGIFELSPETEIGEVAGDDDVVGRHGAHVGEEGVEDGIVVDAGAVAPPVEVAERALGEEVARRDVRQRAQVRIGKVGDEDHRAGLAD